MYKKCTKRKHPQKYKYVALCISVSRKINSKPFHSRENANSKTRTFKKHTKGQVDKIQSFYNPLIAKNDLRGVAESHKKKKVFSRMLNCRVSNPLCKKVRNLHSTLT